MTTALGSRFEIDIGPQSVQRLLPPSTTERFEGIDFSTSGKVLAIATSDTNAVLLFRRQANGRFEEAPYARIDKSNAGLDYPHDVSFGPPVTKRGVDVMLAGWSSTPFVTNRRRINAAPPSTPQISAGR